MPKLMIHGKPTTGSFSSADKIKYDDNTNVKEAIDDLLDWELIGTSSGNYDFSRYKEILFYAKQSTYLLLNVPTMLLDSNLKWFRTGCFMSSTNNSGLQVQISISKLNAWNYSKDGSTVSDATIEIYGR